MKLIFEIGAEGRRMNYLPECDVPKAELPSSPLRKDAPKLPELTEVELSRHYTRLAKQAFGVNSGFYPLGSCTMKYNPKVNEEVARYSGFSRIHPYQSEKTVQGALELLYQTDNMLAEITGMARVSLQPAAGAHGEMAGLMIIKAYHQNRGDTKRQKIVVPDSSHGTNPASAAVVGRRFRMRSRLRF